MNLGLDHKIIIVSSGAKGIGKAIQEIEDLGANADLVTAELSQPEECKKAIDEM